MIDDTRANSPSLDRDKRASSPGPEPEDMALESLERFADETVTMTRGQREAIHTIVARIDERWEFVQQQLSNLFARINKLPCGEHLALLKHMDEEGTTAQIKLRERLAALESQMAAVSSGSRQRPLSEETRPRSKTDPNNPLVRKEDMESSFERFVRPLAREAAEEAADERIREAEEQRDRLSRALELAREKAQQEAEDAAAKLEAVRVKAATEAAEADARLEAQRVSAEERRRKFISNLVIGALTALVSGGGVGLALRCESKATPAPRVVRVFQTPATRPALDASVFNNGKR